MKKKNIGANGRPSICTRKDLRVICVIYLAQLRHGWDSSVTRKLCTLEDLPAYHQEITRA